MENNTLLGATADSTQQYDGSGVFNTNTPTGDVDTSSSTAPDATETEDSSEKPAENTSGLLMYAGAALLLYYFFFKKK
jgi:hypothetical protein